MSDDYRYGLGEIGGKYQLRSVGATLKGVVSHERIMTPSVQVRADAAGRRVMTRE